ncbi:MAG: carboxylating nicotinate-nucleotide diphosphorylase [Actinomycetota bacterium]
MPEDLTVLASSALAEDAPAGDLTTGLTVRADVACTAELIAKQPGVIAGVDVARAVFEAAASQDGTSVEVDVKAPDGTSVGPGDRVAVVRGSARTILRAERPAVNLLGHLSGVATLTRRFVEAAAPAAILCTRKTTPGLRALERAAVLAGGGTLHRASLSDAILIKDNHVRIAGGVAAAVADAKRGGVPVEVEVETLEQLDEAVSAGADRVLLDNPTPELVAQAIERLGGAERLEVSGGVTLESVASFVAAGARTVSVGALTHSAPTLDLSLEVVDVHG